MIKPTAGGFGNSQTNQSPFGGPSPAPFGQTPSVFGQQNSSPFGASSAGLFGASSPAFGGSQAPSFGASSSAFGSSAFGQSRPNGGGFSGFGGGNVSSPFGSSQPAFGGQQSTPAFGTQSFGTSSSPNPFGGGGGGFGQSQGGFGNAFTAGSSPAFGSSFGGGGFGAQQQQSQGSRGVTYAKVTDQEGAAGSARQTVHFCTITQMPAFQPPHEKNMLELRWEDYQSGVKGNTGGSPGSFGPQQGAGFSSSQPSNPFAFSPQQQASPAFGGQPAPAFGQTTPAASGFGQSSPMFGANTGASLFGNKGGTPGFGQSSSPFSTGTSFTSTPTFGQSSSAFGNFGQSAAGFSSTGFASSFASTPGFGNPQSSSAFGTTSLFGQTPTPQFGQQSSSGFGFGQSSSTPSFQSSPGFGLTQPSFSQASAPTFSFSNLQASNSGAGGTSTLFTNNNAFTKPGGGFLGSQSSPSIFGNQSPGASLFPTPSTGGGLFANNSFAPSTGSGFAGFAQQNQQPGMLQAAQAPGVGVSPYGMLPAAPEVGSGQGEVGAEYRVGIATRPTTFLSHRTMALISPRTIAPKSTPVARRSLSRPRPPRRSSSSLVDTIKQEPEAEPQSGKGLSMGPSIFVPRTNPLQFFVRDSLPSTESATNSDSAPLQRPVELSADKAVQKEDLHLNGKASPHLRKQTPAFQSGRQQKHGSEGETQTEAEEQARQAGRAPRSVPQPHPRPLNDDEISAMLPFTNQEHFYVEPSLTQLAAMAREDEQSLENVSNFRVGHRLFGSVRWLEPVDVRDLDIDAVVSIYKGSVEVYIADSRKPGIGDGLNKSAEVTLLGIYKLDKASKRPVTDQDSIDKYIKKLKATAASQGARFIEYKPEGGVWRFQVDHFSKYGLLESDSDAEEPGGTVQLQPALLPPRPPSPASDVAETIHDDKMQEDDDWEESLGEEAGAEGRQAGAGPRERAAASSLLACSLPAVLNLQPTELAWMRGSLYPEGAELSGEGQPQRPGKRPPAEGLTAPRSSLRARLDPRGQNFEPTAALQSQRHNCSWLPPADIVLPPKPTQHPGGGTGMQPVVPQQGLVTAQGSDGQDAHSQTLVDSGLALGKSCRGTWGLDATFIHPAFASGSVSALVTQRIGREAAVGINQPSQQQTADFMRGMLEVYAEAVRPVGVEAEGKAAPVWALDCNCKEELYLLCRRFIQVLQHHLGQVHGAGQQRTSLQHQVRTWELVALLFSEIPATHLTGGGGGLMLGSGGHEGVLLASMRRARVSTWLKEAAWVEVEEAVRGGGTAFYKIAQLLSCHRLQEAAALAASTANPRLAVAILQAGASQRAREDIAAQLEMWRKTGVSDAMEAEVVQIYTLLAGNPGPVIQHLEVGWMRAFGMYLWYACPANAAIPVALDMYSEAAEGGQAEAPPPLPLYVQRWGWQPGQAKSVDVCYTLLQVFAGRLDMQAWPDLCRLLRPEAHTAEPLNSLFTWLLLQVLSSVPAFLPTPVSQHQGIMLAKDMIGQLQRVGGLPEWEVFVAAHIPALEGEAAADKRIVIIRDLLDRNAAQLTRSDPGQEFILGLHIPAAWMSASFALWARYTGNQEEELNFWINARNWPAAHQVLIEQLAPAWFLAQPQEIEKLQCSVRTLAGKETDIDQALGYGTYARGVGLYASYFALQELIDLASGETSGQELLTINAREFADKLNKNAVDTSDSFPQLLQVRAQMAASVSASAQYVAGSRCKSTLESAEPALKLETLPTALHSEVLQLFMANLSQISLI